MAVCSTAAYAQQNTSAVGKNNHEEKREERMKNMAPEQREKMEERRKKFEALSPEKKEAVKAERKRHRAEMEKITGEKFDGPEEGK